MTKPLFFTAIFITVVQTAYAQYCKSDKAGNRQGYWMEAEMQNEEHYGVVPYNYAIGKYIDDKKSGIWYYYDTAGLLVQSEFYLKDTVIIKQYHSNNKIKAEGKAYLVDYIHEGLIMDPLTGDIDTIKSVGPPVKTRCGIWKYSSIDGNVEKIFNYN